LEPHPQENRRDLGQRLVRGIPHANIGVEQNMLQMDESLCVVSRWRSSIGVVEIPSPTYLKEWKAKVCPPRKDHRVWIVEVVAQLARKTDGVLQLVG
jgi:hypothetical protein